MFYKKFIELCNSRGVTPSHVGLQVGVSKAAVSGWKNGSSPRDTQMQKIADYFGVPVSYFSEEAPETEKAPAPSKGTEVFMKMYDMLTPERQARLYETLSDLVKEQMQER
jgi:transcriptional regulator with XRE-family HTH domain